MSLLTIENIVKSYFHKTVLDHVSLRVQEGDRLGFIGANGAGKTTLFKIINGQEKAEEGQIIKTSNVIIGYLTQHIDDSSGIEFSALRSRELEELEHEIHTLEIKMGSFENHECIEYRTITQEYERLTSKFESLDGYSYERNMKETLQGLGLKDNALLRPLSSLSGGEKMRVALARILLMRPDILLLDEPTNHLDVNAMEWLEDYLSKFKGAMILISHDRYFLDKVTNQTAELDSGKLETRPGNYTKYMAQKSIELDFARKELSRIEKELERQTQVKQTMLSHRNMSGYHAREKVVDKLSDELSNAKSATIHSLSKRMSFKILPKEQIGDPKRILVQADLLGKAFDGNIIFSDVSFLLRACDKIVLAGPNGCGKTTLLSLLLGQLSDYDGTVRCSSNMKYAHMGQHVFFDDEECTPLEEFLTRTDSSQGQARSTLARFGFVDVDCYKKISVLSGGERSRLYLACLLSEMPDALFLDEPTNHLDIPSREILEDALSDFNGAIFSISHDRYFIEKCAQKVYGFINGTLEEFTSYEQYRLAEKKKKSITSATNVCVLDATDNSFDSNNEMTLEKSPLKIRQNKAEERRSVALRRKKIRYYEQTIATLEEEKIQLETGFNAETTPEDYRYYADLLVSIDQAYEKYMELQDEDS